jgi:hypothetical protein
MALSQTELRSIGLLSAMTAALAAACTGEPQDTQLGTSSSALTAAKEVPLVDNLQHEFPKARLHMHNGRVNLINGTTLASGKTPEESAEAFKTALLRAHEAKPHDLVPHRVVPGGREVIAKPEPRGIMYDPQTNKFKFWLYRYGQEVAGIPVHGAEVAVLVRNTPDYPVVLATSSLRNIATFVPPAAPRALAVDRDQSLKAAQRDAAKKADRVAPSAIDVFSDPELVIFAGEGEEDVPPRLAMRYTGELVRGLGAWQFIADAVTGDVLNVEDRVHSVNVWGQVRGNVTVNPVAAQCAPEVSVPLPWAEVSIPNVSNGFTNAFGFFSLTNSGTTPVQVTSTLQGRYINVQNYLGDEELLTRSVTPPGPASFLHNQANNDEHVVAQANAYYHVNLARDFVLRYSPDFPVISTQEDFLVDTNGDDTYGGTPGGTPSYYCPGAWYIVKSQDYSWVLFCESMLGWNNTAFGSIAYHEYGHHVADSAGSGQGTYGEGFGDVIAALITGDPREALGYLENDCNSFLRTADNDCQYDPDTCTTNCGGFTGDTHDCGRLLSGIIWDLRTALMASHPTDYQNILYPMVLDSVQHHTGDRIDGSILTVMLEFDDNDGNIYNGTPHSTELCSAFEAHGIDCPIVQTRPCDGICDNPVVFSWSRSYQSGNLQTGAVCRETTQNVVDGNCGNFVSPRTLSVNGKVMTCNNQNWTTTTPPKRNGGYCVSTTQGQYPYAFFTVW